MQFCTPEAERESKNKQPSEFHGAKIQDASVSQGIFESLGKTFPRVFGP